MQDGTQRRCNRVRCPQLFSDTPTCSVPTSSWWIAIVEPFWKSGKVGGKCKGLGSRGDSRLHSHWVGSCREEMMQRKNGHVTEGFLPPATLDQRRGAGRHEVFMGGGRLAGLA